MFVVSTRENKSKLISSDGAALFGAMIQYFQSLGDKCPKVFASTHFHGMGLIVAKCH